jgi:hypothetical protein
MCNLMHLTRESREEFELRLKDVVWPTGQPNDFAEAVEQLKRRDATEDLPERPPAPDVFTSRGGY